MGTEGKNKDNIQNKIENKIENKTQNEMQENIDELDFIRGRDIDADLEEIEKVLIDRYQTFN